MLEAQPILAVALFAVFTWSVVRWFRKPNARPQTLAWAAFGGYLVLVAGATLFPIVYESFGEEQLGTLINVVPLRGLLTPGDIARDQAIPNIVLGIPFGFGIFFVFPSIKPWQALAAGLLIFVGVEALQLLESLAFPRSPRTTDVNDVILNLMGVVLGIVGYLGFAAWFRRQDTEGRVGDSSWSDYLRLATADR